MVKVLFFAFVFFVANAAPQEDVLAAHDSIKGLCSSSELLGRKPLRRNLVHSLVKGYRALADAKMLAFRGIFLPRNVHSSAKNMQQILSSFFEAEILSLYPDYAGGIPLNEAQHVILLQSFLARL